MKDIKGLASAKYPNTSPPIKIANLYKVTIYSFYL